MLRLVLPTMLLGLAATPAATAQAVPPELLGAYSVGRAYSMLLHAQPCRPAQMQAEIERMMEAAQAHIRGPEQRAAYDLGFQRTSQQQRYIGRGDAVACQQIHDGLAAFLATQPGR